MKPSYLFLDHTADVLFKAQGRNLNELFEQCALALEDTQIDIRLVQPKITKKITGRNKQLERLLFDFLDDLLLYKDSEQLIFSRFTLEIKKVKQEYILNGTAKGEKLDSQKHDPKVDAKAITMHLFEVKPVKSGWQAQVLVDI